MTVAALVIFINMQCGISPVNPALTRQQKEDCMERITNCAVGPDGVILPEVVIRCVKPEESK